MVYMMDQKADLYLNQVPGLKCWDMCAGEALIQAMMGIVCDSDHKPLFYDHTAKDFTIQNGIMVSKNKTVFDLTNERLMQNTGHDLPYYQKKTNREVEEYRRAKELRLASNKQTAK